MNNLISIKFFHMFHNDMNEWVTVLGFYALSVKKTSHSIIPLRWGPDCTRFKIYILVIANVVN